MVLFFTCHPKRKTFKRKIVFQAAFFSEDPLVPVTSPQKFPLVHDALTLRAPWPWRWKPQRRCRSPEENGDKMISGESFYQQEALLGGGFNYVSFSPKTRQNHRILRAYGICVLLSFYNWAVLIVISIHEQPG